MRVLKAGDVDEVTLDGVTYRLRVPSVYDDLEVRHACRLQGARPVPDGELEAKLRAGIRAVYQGAGEADEAERWLDLVDEWGALKNELAEIFREHAAPETLERFARLDELSQELDELERVIEAHFEPYRHLIADRMRWLELAPLEAARRFLVGAEGLEAPLELGAGGLSREAFAREIPKAHAQALGAKAVALMGPGREVKKN